MKKGFMFKSMRVVVVLALSLTVAALLVTLRPKAKHQVKTETGRLVEIMSVKSEDLNMIIDGYGTVKPRETLKLAAEIKGQVFDVDSSFKEGSFIKKGAVLIKIDPRIYRLEVDRQKIQIEQTEAEIKKLRQEIKNFDASIKITKANAALARNDFERLKKLSIKNVVAQATLDQAEQRYLASLERLQGFENQLNLTGPLKERLEAQLDMGKVMLCQAKLDLEKTDIIAPFDGWVLIKDVEKGRYVNAGQYIGSVYSDGALDVEIRIPTKDIKWFVTDWKQDAMPDVEIIFRGNNSPHKWRGRVARIKAQVDEKTRTLPVVVEIDRNSIKDKTRGGVQLRPGTFVTALIKGKKIKQVFVLPRYVIHAGDMVYIMTDNRLKIRPVNILRKVRDSVYIDKGLSDGELVVKSPLSGVVDGMKVRINATIQPQIHTDERR
ncbi:MAG: efflux RND transporter periplasmic adaptor subunit [Deltaproteobacteria bacterium]|nr:efflux RND transporter periplasmic adaptor subunit [Deltaproteobacteria bacterium]MBW2661971.1 efflux RND transporter periplasmic adaptor subunit [Deltaproteobacteria bacterium]